MLKLLAIACRGQEKRIDAINMTSRGSWAELMDPLRTHLLQHLPVGSLVQLRATCRAFRNIVDSGICKAT